MSQENEKHVHVLADGAVVEHCHGEHDHENHSHEGHSHGPHGHTHSHAHTKAAVSYTHLDLLNLYGDRGNIQCLMKRCLWRGIEAETIAFELDDNIDFSNLDIVLLGGGSDREQMLVCEKLKEIQKDFKEYVEQGGVVIAICGGYQLLGNYYKTCLLYTSRCV